jgi:hypothetical protein
MKAFQVERKGPKTWQVSETKEKVNLLNLNEKVKQIVFPQQRLSNTGQRFL